MTEAHGLSGEGDFSATRRMLVLAGFAVVIGSLGAVLAWALLRLINFFTNLFYFHQFSFAKASPADNHLGIWALFVPVLGGLILGLMARFGSERIRGHGIPEAIEAIMLNGSRMSFRVAGLKPLSSAISIGSGGPFGAEGPIIMTGGAAGSLLAQFFHFSNAERKTLMIAGAAAGMSAVFATPVAALALAVELLLFEMKPRSLFPVAVASITAAILRTSLLGHGPIFPVGQFHLSMNWQLALFCILSGVLAGCLAWVITNMVYLAEDSFLKLPVHWMWWPAIGGIAVGIGGLIFPQALGVGYDVIEELLTTHASMQLILGVLVVKSVIWAIPLGAGTSGGVLAPMLMMGAALGALEGRVFPDHGTGFWALIGMCAILAGTMRVPFTALFFAIELTHDMSLLLPLMIAAVIAYGTTVLILPRSVLTEKISRRGYHITREYSIDPLEVLMVRDVMRTDIAAFPISMPLSDVQLIARESSQRKGQHLYPVLADAGAMVGVVTRRTLWSALDDPNFASAERPLETLSLKSPQVVGDRDTLRSVLNRMAESGLMAYPVVDSGTGELKGLIGLRDMVTAEEKTLNEERTRERWLRVRLFGRSSQEVVNT
ncbi:MAG: chloride channel protein [Thermomicrobiales bacterium]|nr:chloride channel protein [Thermomicrobiales bacterium]